MNSNVKKYKEHINKSSEQCGINPSIIAKVIQLETSGITHTETFKEKLQSNFKKIILKFKRK